MGFHHKQKTRMARQTKETRCNLDGRCGVGNGMQTPLWFHDDAAVLIGNRLAGGARGGRPEQQLPNIAGWKYDGAERAKGEKC
jgi:hypothetical protein